MNTEVMFSSATDEWATPQDLFDELNSEFRFELDVCANESNHKCDKYYTKEQDGLLMPWSADGAIWCNPPYGREIGKWVNRGGTHPQMQRWLCFYPQGLIPSGFMTISTRNQMLKFDSSKVALNLETVRILRRFRL